MHGVVVLRVLEVRALRAEVLHLNDGVASNFLGHTQAPLLGITVCPTVLRSGQQAEDGGCQATVRVVDIACPRQGGTRDVGGVSGPKLRGRARDRVLDEIHQLRARIEDSVSAAYDGAGAAERTIGEAEAWGNVVLVGSEQRLAVQVAEA